MLKQSVRIMSHEPATGCFVPGTVPLRDPVRVVQFVYAIAASTVLRLVTLEITGGGWSCSIDLSPGWSVVCRAIVGQTALPVTIDSGDTFESSRPVNSGYRLRPIDPRNRSKQTAT